MFRSIKEVSARVKNYFRITNASEISRRYFVMSSFDGALAILGVIIGVYSTGRADAHLIISSGIGLALASGISGFVGASLSERAERMKEMKEIEDSLMIEVKGSLIHRASRFVTVTLAVVNGISPTVTIILTLVPFIAHMAFPSIISLNYAVLTSVVINLSTLAFLGIYLGKIADANRLKYSIMTVSIGIAIVFILYFVGI